MHSHMTPWSDASAHKQKPFRRRPTFGVWVVDRDHGLVPKVGSMASIGVRRRVGHQRSSLCLRMCTAPPRISVVRQCA